MNEAKRFLTIGGCLTVAMLVAIGVMRTIDWNNFVGGFMLVLIATVVLWAATLRGE